MARKKNLIVPLLIVGGGAVALLAAGKGSVAATPAPDDKSAPEPGPALDASEQEKLTHKLAAGPYSGVPKFTAIKPGDVTTARKYAANGFHAALDAGATDAARMYLAAYRTPGSGLATYETMMNLIDTANGLFDTFQGRAEQTTVSGSLASAVPTSLRTALVFNPDGPTDQMTMLTIV